MKTISKIVPEAGDRVTFHPHHHRPTDPAPPTQLGTVGMVWGETCVNLTLDDGTTASSVFYRAPGDPQRLAGYYCEPILP